jgi:hypothetical protein
VAWQPSLAAAGPAPALIHEEAQPAALSESSRTNVSGRLPIDPLGRIEGGDGVSEGRDIADVRLQPTPSCPADILTAAWPLVGHWLVLAVLEHAELEDPLPG